MQDESLEHLDGEEKPLLLTRTFWCGERKFCVMPFPIHVERTTR